MNRSISHHLPPRSDWCVALCLLSAGSLGLAAPKVSDLRARHVHGQTYLMWNEENLTPELRVAVFCHSEPISAANTAKAKLLSADLMPGTSCDFYGLLDKHYRRYEPLPEGVNGAAVPWGTKIDPDTGLVIPGRIEPYHGLYVRTVEKPAKTYYAVLVRDKDDRDLTKMEPGVSSLTDLVDEKPEGACRPIQVLGRPFARKAGAAPLHLNVILGGCGQRQVIKRLTKHEIPLQHYVLYGDADQGWREGVPSHFSVEEIKGEGDADPFYKLRFCQSEFSFMGAPRGHCFYGVNRNIVRPAKMAEGVVSPQSHRVILEVLEWVKATYPVDADRVWLSASSIQGNGGFMLLLRHPEPFCAADVTTVAPDMKLLLPFRSNADVIWGPVETVRTSEGPTVAEVVCLTEYLKKHPVLLPPMRLANGRNDPWRPWQMCPPFYRALLEQGQPVWIFWDNRSHSNRSRRKRFAEPFGVGLWEVFPRDKAFLGFANGSTNNDFGNGDKTDGDLAGAVNAYYRWGNVTDTKEKFSAEYWYERDGNTDGGAVDVIVQRLQRFPHKQATNAKYRILSGGNVVKQGEVSADAFGRFWIARVPASGRHVLELVE